MPAFNPPKKLLTIGGSDSGGAAGIQADLKTFTALGAYGMSALTVATAQNSIVLEQAHFLPADFVAAQYDLIMADYGADGIKSGFIGDAALVKRIAGMLTDAPCPILIDPVLVTGTGRTMFGAEVTQAYVEYLFPAATLITPNWREAALIAGIPVDDVQSAADAAAKLQQLGAQRILVTGIPAEDTLIDLYFDGKSQVELPTPRLDTPNTLGSGDTLSAAIITFMAEGADILPAIERAQKFTRLALKAAKDWRLGGGEGPVAQWHSTLA